MVLETTFSRKRLSKKTCSYVKFFEFWLKSVIYNIYMRVNEGSMRVKIRLVFSRLLGWKESQILFG